MLRSTSAVTLRNRISSPLLEKMLARWTPFLIGAIVTLISAVLEVKAASTGLAWDPDSSPNVVGYRLHSGTTSGVYMQISEVGNVTSILVSNLIPGKKYFFVVTAYNTAALESAPSNEVSFVASSSSPTPTSTPTPISMPT